jgi:hypothetical protein
MKTTGVLFLVLLTAACQKDDAEVLSDYRDKYTGTYLCSDSIVVWSPDSTTGTRIDTQYVQTTAVLIEKMSASDSSISILGEEFWLTKTGACNRAYFNGPLGMSYHYEVSLANSYLDYSLTATPLNHYHVTYRKLRGSK